MECKECCIIGYNVEESKEKYKEIKKALIELIKNNVDCFLFYEFGKFAHVCFEILDELRDEYKNVRIVYCYQENILNQNLQKYKQLSQGIYDDFFNINIGENDSLLSTLKMIHKADCIIFSKLDMDNNRSKLFHDYCCLLEKEILYL